VKKRNWWIVCSYDGSLVLVLTHKFIKHVKFVITYETIILRAMPLYTRDVYETLRIVQTIIRWIEDNPKSFENGFKKIILRISTLN